MEDWKRVIWSDKTKINCLRLDGCKWVWKRPGEGLSNRLVERTVKFEGGFGGAWFGKGLTMLLRLMAG